MNEIRQLCISSSSPGKHLDEILALFHACPPQHLLPSLSLIGQSISCMPIEQIDINLIHHPLFLVIRQWAERLLQLWLVNGTLNGEEYRALFYTHQLFKLLSEWLQQQEESLLDQDEQKFLRTAMSNLFINENFLQTLCRVVVQLLSVEDEDQPNDVTIHISDDEDQVSPDDIQLQTQTSDDQAGRADVLDALFRCVNSLVILFSHPSLLNNTLVHQYLTPCILDCLDSSLFIELATQSLQQTFTYEKIHIRSVFLLGTCLDYSASSTTTSTLRLLPSVRKILHVWCEIPQKLDEDTSPLIIRLVRLINRLALSNKDAIIEENLCAFLVPHFENLCLSSSVIDDIVSLLLTLSTTVSGKRHLRRLGFVQQILQATKRYNQLWHPLAFLINQRDLNQSSTLKRLIHLITQRTINVFQALASASNDTSFDSTAPSSKNQAALVAIEWFTLVRTNFLPFSIIVDELINYTKKVNFMNMLIDTILSLQQDDEGVPRLIEILVELLWTLSFSTSTKVHEILKKRLDLCRWLRTNLNNSIDRIVISSQAILSILDSTIQTLDRTNLNYRQTLNENLQICMLHTDETHFDLSMTIRHRLQQEFRCGVDMIATSSYQSLDSFIDLIDRSSLCLFCISTRMKTDNLSHFVQRYMSFQAHPIPLLAILIENDCELDGCWLKSITIVDPSTIVDEISRHFDQIEDHEIRLPSRTSDASTSSRTQTMTPDEFRSQSRTFMHRPLPHWSTEDVSEWCEATQGTFESLQPLVMRLNGSALVHLAEILSIEPASMYHSLNDELLQRTGTSVPITEYVALRSELEQLLVQKQNLRAPENEPISPRLNSTTTNSNGHRKKRWKKSRLCTLL